jgi:NhaA family Na+:H+ antiporter
MFEDRVDESHLSMLEQFEHDVKTFVDFGLFFFAFANAGVALAGTTNLTWIVLLALVLGKILGISTFSFVDQKRGFPLATGMTTAHLIVASAVAGIGLTVALFVSGQAFTDGAMQGAAKMGALFSVIAAPVGFVLRQTLLAKTPPAHE